jgi:hypothetical protein
VAHVFGKLRQHLAFVQHHKHAAVYYEVSPEPTTVPSDVPPAPTPAPPKAPAAPSPTKT